MGDGQAQDLSGEYRWIDTYGRRNGQWQLVAGASTPVMKGPAGKPTPSSSPSPSMKASPGAKASPTTKPSPAMKPSPAIKATPASSPAKTKTPNQGAVSSEQGAVSSKIIEKRTVTSCPFRFREKRVGP